MNRLNITAKIWLSVGVFVLGYVLATVLGQVQGISTERTSRIASNALFPAAQRSQEVEAAFQKMVKGFSDAVMTQDASGVERASDEGRQVVSGLKSVAGVEGVPAARAEAARKLANMVDAFLNDARSVYGTVLSNPAGMSPDTQDKMRDLASRTDAIKASLQSLKEQSADDLHQSLASVERGSAQQRWFALAVFAVTLVLAGVIVNLMIRRAITGPVLRVIDGVEAAVSQSASASDRMNESGQVVAKDAQEQAACIEETSASL